MQRLFWILLRSKILAYLLDLISQSTATCQADGAAEGCKFGFMPGSRQALLIWFMLDPDHKARCSLLLWWIHSFSETFHARKFAVTLLVHSHCFSKFANMGWKALDIVIFPFQNALSSLDYPKFDSLGDTKAFYKANKGFYNVNFPKQGVSDSDLRRRKLPCWLLAAYFTKK